MRHLSLTKTAVFRRLAFSPDGQRLAVCSSNNVRIWDVASGKPALVLPNTSTVRDLAFTSPTWVILETGAYIIVPEMRKPFTWDLVPRDEFILGIAVSPDGSRLVSASGLDDNTVIECRRLADDEPIWRTTRLISHSYHARLAFSGDGSRLLTQGVGVGVFDAEMGAELAFHASLSRAGEAGDQLAVSHDGRTAAILVGGLRDIINVDTGEVLANLPLRTTAVAFTHDGWLGSTVGSRIEFRSPPSWQVGSAYDPESGPLHALAFSPDGMLGAAGGTRGRIVLWDM